MAKKMKSLLLWFTRTFQFPPDLFDCGPGVRRLTKSDGTPNSPYWFDNNADAWRHDWENIGGDFRRAAARLEMEMA